MSQDNNEEFSKIEDSLKLLMQNLTDNEVQHIEKNFLNEYENLGEFSVVVVKFFDYFTKKIDEQLKKRKDKSRKNDSDSDESSAYITESEEYRRLEQILQKHEAENRNYLRMQLQMKLMIDSNNQKYEDLEKEKQEAINSIKQHLQQKNKEILSLHNEISQLKKMIEDMQGINDNQEFSIKEYEKQIAELTQYKQKSKNLQKMLDEQSKISQQTALLPKKEGSFKAMNISLNLKKSLNNEIKHSSDPDLNKHALNSNNSSRNKNQLNASSISTLCTNTNQKLATPNKNERVKNPNNFLQNNLLSVSSRGGNSILNNNNTNVYQSQYSNSNCGGYLGGVSSTNTQSLNSHPMHEIQEQVNQQANSSAQKMFQDYSIKQQLIKQIKDVNKESLNKSNQKEQKVNSHNTSQHMESKDLAAYLNSGPIQSIQNSNNNSFVGVNNGLKQHKRSKSQQGSKMKGGAFVNNSNNNMNNSHMNSAGRASSSLNHRNRNLNSSSYHHNTSAADYSSLMNILNKESYLDMNINSINANHGMKPINNNNINNNSFNNINNKINISSSSYHNNNNNNNNSNNNMNNVSNSSFSQQQMMMQLYNQSNNNGLSASRNIYSSTGKRSQSRTAQNK